MSTGHYIKILDWVEPYARTVAPLPPNWAQALFDDLTENGRKLTVVSLPGNERGPRLGLCGETFFCEAGMDRDRSDTLFISRVESAAHRLPPSVPKSIGGPYRLMTSGRVQTETLEPVRCLFGLVEAPAWVRADGAALDVGERSRSRPSAALRHELTQAGVTLRTAWRPTAGAPQKHNGKALFESILNVWNRFRLGRFIRLPPRQSMIFNRQVEPYIGDLDELRPLLSAFDLELLNAVAVAEPSTVAPLLADLAALPMSAHVRAAVWCGTLVGLDGVELRRELHTVATALMALGAEAETAAEWTALVLETLDAIAVATADTALADRVQTARDASEPLCSLGTWAGELQFQGREEPPAAPPSMPIDEVSATISAAVGEPAESSIDMTSRSVVDDWVLRLVTPGPDFVAELGREIAARLNASLALSRSGSSLETLVGLLADLQELSAAAAEWTRRAPSARIQLDLREEAAAEFIKAEAELGADAARLLAKTPTPNELSEIVDLVKRRTVLEHVPEWLRPENPVHAPVDAALWLSDAVERSRFAALLGVIDELAIEDLAMLSELPTPPTGADLDAHLRGGLRSLLEVEYALRELGPEHRAWIETRLAAGDAKADLVQAANELEAMRPRLHPDTLAALMVRVGAQPSTTERNTILRAYEAAICFFENNLGSAADASIGQLESRVARQGPSENGESRTPAATHELTVEHALIGADPARSPVSFRRIRDLPYGYITVPLIVEASRPADYSLRLEIDVKGKWRHAWPSNWPEPGPSDLQISRDKWRQTDQQRYTFTHTLEIPTRSPGGGLDPLEVIIVLHDAIRGEALSIPKALRWDHVEPEVTTLTFDWPEGLKPGYVETHPIGPQKKIDQIVKRVQSGSSFAVVAPRRFGKSTLIEYLAARLRSEGCIVPQPIVCTEFFDSTGIDHPHLWRDVSDRLQRELGAALQLDLDAGIPIGSAFDYVRRAAHKKRKRAIVLLFDESQLFFSGPSSTATGDRLKDRLERAWGQPTDGKLAPVLFGFVGLLSLVERAGANLAGLLRPIENREMDEADLNRLLLSVTRDRLATTREARLELIGAAGNLFLLRILVESLVDRLILEGRRWATRNDVLAVEGDLMRELRDGSAQHVGHWLRDALNEADSINDWRPNREYPVALALAEARHQGAHRADDVLQRSRQVLNGWCSEVNDSSPANLSFTVQRIEEHLARLREQGILGQLEFRSPLLEAWLLGQVRTGYPRSARNALVKSAHVTIRMPDGAEPIDSGGQATVLRYTDNGIEKAMRRAALHDDRDRQRFLETAASLEVLAQGEHLDKPGSQYIYHLEAVGFAAEDAMTAVQIYRWIDGSHLGEHVGTLHAPLVADIGYRLALAVSLLHTRHIIHRDIRPRNIILARHDKRPVLIDFGMSRLETSAMLTAAPSEFSPPEVQTAAPHWTRAADIFGLGSTLASLLAQPKEAPAELRKVLASCTDDDPQKRPDASTVTQYLREIRERLQVDDRRRIFWASVQETAASDGECSWFMEVLRKFQSSFEALHLGIHSDTFERAAEIADFLNQLLEAYPVQTGAQRLSLGYVKRVNDVTGDQLVDESIEFLHNARTWLSHGSGKARHRERILAGVGEPRAERIQTRVLDGTTLIQSVLGLHSLRTVVEQVTRL
jgi:tRNA A-37 threonylcarbamoyl transferase component Bud32